MEPAKRLELYAGLALWTLLVAAGLIWSLGLTGTFALDDFWNLRDLEDIGRRPTLDEGLQFVARGIASQLGRPLALATFALQYASWPHAPGSFIAVNILLHLLNATLLYAVLLRLLRLAAVGPREALLLGLAATLLWTLAPLHATTVLYIVQRMAVLAGTCLLLGLLLYLAGREAHLRGRSARGYLLMTAGVGVGLGVGVLAKESAALFPLMLLATEATLLHAQPRPRAWRAWASVCLALPLALLAAYLAWRLPDFAAIAERHGLPMTERLLTEGRVLFGYLRKLFLPPLYSVRLLYDDLPVSASLWQPATTALSLAAWIALVIAAVLWRRQQPMFGFAVLWFLACHVLESTFVPLEVAFDHRNYVAVIGPLLALAYYAAALARRPQLRRLRLPLAGVAVLYVAFTASGLWHSADLWGRPRELALFWGQTQPDSRRAQHDRADVHLFLGHPGKAADVYREALARWPGDVTFLIGLAEIACQFEGVSRPTPADAAAAMRQFAARMPATVSMVNRLVMRAEAGLCPRYTAGELWDLTEAVFAHPAFQNQRQNVFLVRSRLTELAGERGNARLFLDHALDAKPNLVLLIQAAGWALEAGDRDAAQRYVTMAHTDPAYRKIDRWLFRHELQRLDALLAAPGA